SAAYSRTALSSGSAARVSSRRSYSLRSSTTTGSSAEESMSPLAMRWFTHQSGSCVSGRSSGFPAPGRSSKSPRRAAASIADSTRAPSRSIGGRPMSALGELRETVDRGHELLRRHLPRLREPRLLLRGQARVVVDVGDQGAPVRERLEGPAPPVAGRLLAVGCGPPGDLAALGEGDD